MFGWVCAAMGLALLVIGIGQKAEAHFWPKPAASYENAPLVPEYELRRQQDDAWVKRYMKFGFV